MGLVRHLHVTYISLITRLYAIYNNNYICRKCYNKDQVTATSKYTLMH